MSLDHRPRPKRPSRTALLLAAALATASCSTNPATGERQFTALLSPEKEQALGAQEHPKVMAEFGGPYDNARVQAYVDRLGQRLAAKTEIPDIKYTFTVLDSEIVNAFALPGGYVYITRGLMALANNEAQLAGVVGHEIGHITARHTAERYSQGTLAQVGAVLAGVFGGQQIGQVAAQGAQLVLAGWSRGQELEADTLGIRYMADGGFDPREMSSFLDTMGRHAQLQALLAGQPGAADSFSYLQTHPPTTERVEKAAAAAAGREGARWEVDREPYLRLLDGVTYGDSADNGFVRDRVFAHPKLGFRFEVPAGFRLLNGQRQVTALSPDRRAMIIFDGAPAQGVGDPSQFIATAWAPKAQLTGLQRIDVNGMPAATAVTQAQTRGGPVDVRMVAIRWDQDTYYRFLFVTAQDLTRGLAPPLQETTYSFRRLTDRERAALRPYRIQVVSVRPGETVADFVRRMPFQDYPEERFRVLNDIAPGTDLKPGQLVKIVTEE